MPTRCRMSRPLKELGPPRSTRCGGLRTTDRHIDVWEWEYHDPEQQHPARGLPSPYDDCWVVWGNTTVWIGGEVRRTPRERKLRKLGQRLRWGRARGATLDELVRYSQELGMYEWANAHKAQTNMGI